MLTLLYLSINIGLLYVIFLLIYVAILDFLKTQRHIFFDILITLSKLHDDFNKHTYLKIHTFIFIGILISYFIYQGYFLQLNQEEKKFFVKVLGNGFFLAPLILLIINNQKYIIENFIKTFRIESEKKNSTKIVCICESYKETNLDPNLQRIKNNIIELAKNIDAINQYETLKNKWKIFKQIVDNAIESRLNFERLNSQSLLIVTILLLSGYLTLLIDNIFLSLFFLIISFFILINRVLILGIRSLLKYYCIDRESVIMLNEINKIEPIRVDSSIDIIDISK